MSMHGENRLKSNRIDAVVEMDEIRGSKTPEHFIVQLVAKVNWIQVTDLLDLQYFN